MSDCRFGVSPVNYPDPDPDPFSRVVQEIRGTILQSCSKVSKLVSQSRLVIPVMMKLLILSQAFFQYGYHDMVESSMRVKFCLFLFKDKII